MRHSGYMLDKFQNIFRLRHCLYILPVSTKKNSILSQKEKVMENFFLTLTANKIFECEE